MPYPTLAQRYPHICSMREAARRRLPQAIFDFADGGAEDERTLRRNESAFGRWAFVPQPLRGAGVRDQSLTLFGQTLSGPVLIGPTGLASEPDECYDVALLNRRAQQRCYEAA